MEVKINQVVLHLLDPGASEPVLSDRAMDMDADLYEYYTATLERAFASDEVKNCRFLPDSAFAAEMAQNQDFIDLSRRIAGVIFEQMLQYQAIPAGDLAVVDFTADGVPFYGVLKLINFAHGDLFTIGAYLGLTLLVSCNLSGMLPLPLAVLAVFIMVGLLVALLGFLLERAAYRPLRNAGRLSAVVSALGASIFFQNAVMTNASSFRSGRLFVDRQTELQALLIDFLIDGACVIQQGFARVGLVVGHFAHGVGHVARGVVAAGDFAEADCPRHLFADDFQLSF